MHEIARYVFRYLEHMSFVLPHKKRVIVLTNDDETNYRILIKKVYPDGTDEAYKTSELGQNVSPTEFHDWLMRQLLNVACQLPDPRLPEITEEDRKWMRFEIK